MVGYRPAHRRRDEAG